MDKSIAKQLNKLSEKLDELYDAVQLTTTNITVFNWNRYIDKIDLEMNHEHVGNTEIYFLDKSCNRPSYYFRFMDSMKSWKNASNGDDIYICLYRPLLESKKMIFGNWELIANAVSRIDDIPQGVYNRLQHGIEHIISHTDEWCNKIEQVIKEIRSEIATKEFGVHGVKLNSDSVKGLDR